MSEVKKKPKRRKQYKTSEYDRHIQLDLLECIERLVYSAPTEFCSYPMWIKAVMLAENVVKKYEHDIVEQ